MVKRKAFQEEKQEKKSTFNILEKHNVANFRHLFTKKTENYHNTYDLHSTEKYVINDKPRSCTEISLSSSRRRPWDQL